MIYDNQKRGGDDKEREIGYDFKRYEKGTEREKKKRKKEREREIKRESKI